MRSAHQNSMKSSSGQKSKTTLLWTLRTSTTTSICISMWRLKYKKTVLLVTSISISKDTLIFNNNLSQIVTNLPILGAHRPTIHLENCCWWHWLMTPVKNLPCHLRPARLLTSRIMKYQYGQFCPDFSMHAPLILEG